jgi:hypothetical protein
MSRLGAELLTTKNDLGAETYGTTKIDMDAVHRDALAQNDTESFDGLTHDEKLMKEEEQSFYSASDNEHGDDNIWGLLSGVGGNIYEW